jgi:hypothetical protein
MREVCFRPHTFEFIYSIGLFIGHASFDRYISRTLFNLLKPGGRLFFTVQDIAPGLTGPGLRHVMEHSPFSHYEIARHASAPFYECTASKDLQQTERAEGEREPKAPHDDDVRSLDVMWRNMHLMTQDIMAVVPAGDTIIFVDHEVFRPQLAIGRRVWPFLESEGGYGGPPPDDVTAVTELERLRRSGAGFIIFAWPAFWWLDYYKGLRHHLRSRFSCVRENELLIVFDLRS